MITVLAKHRKKRQQKSRTEKSGFFIYSRKIYSSFFSSADSSALGSSVASSALASVEGASSSSSIGLTSSITSTSVVTSATGAMSSTFLAPPRRERRFLGAAASSFAANIASLKS